MGDDLFHERIYCGETGGEGTCTLDPALIAIRETIVLYAKILAYYLLNFYKTEYFEMQIAEKIIEILSSVVVNADFNNKEFEFVIGQMFNKILEYQKIYIDILGRKPIYIFTETKAPTMIDIIKQGEKYIVKNNTKYSKDVRDLYSILIYLLRSMTVHINELKDYKPKTQISEYIISVLKLLNKLNKPNNTSEDIMRGIKEFSKTHYKLINDLEQTLNQEYGPVVSANIKQCELNGYSILVSGHNFYELKKLLDATKNTNINIYTHDGLINAHSFTKFKEYSNLVGHYQKYLHSTPADFALFNGAIFITNSPMDEFDSFVRGRIFTTSMFSGLGITKIDSDDFSSLIQTSLDMQNSNKKITTKSMEIGNIREHIDDIISEIKDKFHKKEIEQIFIIKFDKEAVKNQEKIDDFINLLPENIFVFATFEIKRKNFKKIDAYYEYGVLYYFIDKLKNFFQTKTLPISIFVSHCNIHTLSYLITLRFKGVKNIYLANCSYFMINPTIILTTEKFFKIKQLAKLLNSTEEEIKKELNIKNS